MGLISDPIAFFFYYAIKFFVRKMLRRNKRYACLSTQILSETQFSDRTQEILPLSTPITEYPLSVHIPISLITSFVMISPGTMSGASGG